MPHNTISMEWAQGAEETTLWMWPNSGDPTTIRFSLREWAQIEKKADREHDGNIQAYITRVLTADLEEHKQVLSSSQPTS